MLLYSTDFSDWLTGWSVRRALNTATADLFPNLVQILVDFCFG
jgi:hypothetical protein